MEINDKIYGNFIIKDKVIRDLINTKTFQRLKKISQYGPPDEFYHFKNSFSRYEHSIGVMLLLRKFGSSLEEQVAGLLHDVSHTAFSHVIDWVLGSNHAEDHQDKIHKKFIVNSELVHILIRHKYDIDAISNIHGYGLLERDLPDLCADRLDYSLREFSDWVNPDLPKLFLDNLITYNDHFVFRLKNVAELFGRNFMRLHNEHWGAPETVVRYYLFSKALKIALDKGFITLKDFYEDDEFLMDKINKANDPNITKLFEILRGKPKFEESDDPEAIKLNKKFRYVDPLYLERNRLVRLSEASPEYNAYLEEQKKLIIMG